MSIAQYNNIFSKSFPKDILLEFSDETLIENDQICEEDMSLEESLCSDANLKFGACESSCFKVRVVNNNNFKGLKLNVSMVLKGVDAGRLIDSDGNYLVDSDDNYLTYYDASNPDSATIDIGEYYVIDDEPSNDRMWRDLTCYDAMYFILNADVTAWYAGLTFPMSMKNFRDSFFTWINSNVISISQNTVTLINDNFMIQGGFEASQLSGKDVIESICELNACFGHIDRTGKFDYITLPSSETITYNWYIDGTGSYEDYVTDAITKVTARGEAEDVGTSVGVDGNTLIIENNPLIYGTEGTTALEDALDNILDAVDGFTYRPYEVQTYGNPMLPVGTSIVINTKRYDHEQGYQPFVINSFVMSRTLTGIQALKDSINASGDKERPSEVNSISSQIERTKGKLHIVKNTVDELSSEIYEIDPQTGVKTSKIQQLSDEIVLKVTSGGQIVQVALSADASTGTSFKVHASNIELTANDKLVLTTGTFQVNSTNLTITSDGSVTCKDLTANTSGEIGGWKISPGTLTARSLDPTRPNDYMQLNSIFMNLILKEGNYEVRVSGGGLETYYSDQLTSTYRSLLYGGTSSARNKRGTSINIEEGGSWFGLGYYDSDEDKYISQIILNNGLNPAGITQGIIAYDNIYFNSGVSLYFGGSYPNITGGTYTYGGTTFDALYIRNHLRVPGTIFTTRIIADYIDTSIGFDSSSNENITKGTWAIGSGTYYGLYLARNVFTRGHYFTTGYLMAESNVYARNTDIVIDTSLNNSNTTGANSYRGFAVYDFSFVQGGRRFAEFFAASDTDGTTRAYTLISNMKTDGTVVSNQLGCRVHKDGTLSYIVTSPTAFRNAIGVNKIGDTAANHSYGTQTCDSGKWESVAAIGNLPAGKYLLIGTANIDGDVTGNRYLVISTGVNGNPISTHAYVASKNDSGKTALQVVVPINIASATTYYLNIYQNSGGNLDATGQLTAIQIKG